MNNPASELFPQHSRRSGAAAVMHAADQAATEHQHLIDENAELRCRIQELEAELNELRGPHA